MNSVMMTDASTGRGFSPVATWLFLICAMVFAMVVLGGVTRLTESGLSMVDWRPVTGWLPPLSDGEWMEVFNRYRTSPEYQQVNTGMSLAAFKEIFWLEYLHRLFGRVIGIVFFIPFVFFLITKRLTGTTVKQCWIMFMLGGLQGILGWYMVKSGLVDEPDVSQYRLAAHLGLALIIYLYVMWVAVDLVQPRAQFAISSASSLNRRIRPYALALLGLIFVTALSGALVAGLDAGFLYNTFPLMDGALLPPEALELQPWYLNFFENRAMVQFDHRVLAMVTVLLVGAFWWFVHRSNVDPHVKKAAGLLVISVLVQVGIGITTLVLIVPIALGAVHQAGAVAVLTAGLWLVHQTRRG